MPVEGYTVDVSKAVGHQSPTEKVQHHFFFKKKKKGINWDTHIMIGCL
jgi:hypothetical protein